MSRHPVLTLLVSLLVASVAHAQRPDDNSARLRWTRSDDALGCISPEALERAVEAHLDSDALNPSRDTATLIAGHVQALGRARGFIATVRLSRDGVVSGERQVRVRGRDCRKLDDALVLVIALTLQTPSYVAPSPPQADGYRDALPTIVHSDEEAAASATHDALQSVEQLPPGEPHSEPSAQLEQDPDAPTPETMEPVEAPEHRVVRRVTPGVVRRVTPGVVRPAVTAPVVASQSSRRGAHAVDTVAESSNRPLARWEFGAGVGAAAGWMPAPALGASVAFGWRVNAGWIAELAGNLWPSGERPTDVGSAHFLIGYGQARVCPTLLSGAALRLEACGGALLGAVYSEGRDFDQAVSRDTSALLGVAASLRSTLRLSDTWRARLLAELLLPVTRQRFVVRLRDGALAELHRTPAVVGVLGVELVLAL